jgi:hypothetical protein
MAFGSLEQNEGVFRYKSDSAYLKIKPNKIGIQKLETHSYHH